MAVVRLKGLIDSREVGFEKAGDAWLATIPADLNGTYAVELWAYDEAGNVGYRADYIVTIDLASLCVHLEPFPYSARREACGYRAQSAACDFYADLLPVPVLASAYLSDYYATIVKPACGGSI